MKQQLEQPPSDIQGTQQQKKGIGVKGIIKGIIAVILVIIGLIVGIKVVKFASAQIGALFGTQAPQFFKPPATFTPQNNPPAPGYPPNYQSDVGINPAIFNQPSSGFQPTGPCPLVAFQQASQNLINIGGKCCLVYNTVQNALGTGKICSGTAYAALYGGGCCRNYLYTPSGGGAAPSFPSASYITPGCVGGFCPTKFLTTGFY